MNGDGCQECQNSPWVQRANKFINNSSNPREQVEAVRFLLQNGHCGISNRTSIENILRNQKINLTREEFQNNILTDLKKEGIVATLLYSGPKGGVFIPCDVSEIREVAKQVLERIVQELRNLEKIDSDGFHLLLGFIIKETKHEKFITIGWKLVDLSKIKVSLKAEFNADNLEIYKSEAIIKKEWLEKL